MTVRCRTRALIGARRRGPVGGGAVDLKEDDRQDQREPEKGQKRAVAPGRTERRVRAGVDLGNGHPSAPGGAAASEKENRCEVMVR